MNENNYYKHTIKMEQITTKITATGLGNDKVGVSATNSMPAHCLLLTIYGTSPTILVATDEVPKDWGCMTHQNP